MKSYCKEDNKWSPLKSTCKGNVNFVLVLLNVFLRESMFVMIMLIVFVAGGNKKEIIFRLQTSPNACNTVNFIKAVQGSDNGIDLSYGLKLSHFQRQS